MRHSPILLAAAAIIAIPATSFADNWVTFVNQTSTRLVAAPALGSADPEEKDFAYGDLDQDGDIDLIVVRKQPVTTSTGKRNVLFMNEGGVLVDRSIEFAVASSDGSQGFLDVTNDRDITIVDVDKDGWPDLLTCTALNQSSPKTISHPRIYMNLKKDGNGNWLGFRYEEARIPQLPTAPNGCGINTGDVTGDGFPDIYLVTYNSSQGDRLLINNGAGFFSDQTLSRMTPGMIASGFGTTAWIVDMNGDGINDCIKSENGPFKITYNNPANVGHFNVQETPSSGSHYNSSVGDLNNDGKMDAVISDDGSDRYLINVGNGADGLANFQSHTYSFQSGGDDGIAGNSRIVDLNNDGFNDVVISDFDVDIPGCGRRMHLYRNLGNVPQVTLQDQGTCGIPTGELTGMHDVAIFDIDGDGWKDMVLGRCSGIRVWMNQPPFGLVVTYPNGLPALVSPEKPYTFVAHLQTIGAATVIPGTPVVHASVSGGREQTTALSPLGGGDYEVTLPAAACTEDISWWITAQINPGGNVADPQGAPTSTYKAMAALSTKITRREEFEGDVSSWTVVNDASLTGGAWQVADPTGTVANNQIAAPDDDATSGDGVKAFVTLDGPLGGSASASDVDFGPTRLTSNAIDLHNADAFVSFAAWFFCSNAGTAQADSLIVDVSNDNGQTWTTAKVITGTGSLWQTQFIRVSDWVVPTAQVRFRFSTMDTPNNSTTEAGIDNFQVETILCSPSCITDLNGDSTTDAADLAVLLGAWGTSGVPGFPGDVNEDGTVDGTDLGMMLGAWGLCL